jgi:uncharacterized protein YjaG (DUF416 family)
MPGLPAFKMFRRNEKFDENKSYDNIGNGLASWIKIKNFTIEYSSAV